jgi:guanyl-specific ribonuclease Sa
VPVTVASSHNLAPPEVQSPPVAGSAPPPAKAVAAAAEVPKKKSVLPYVLVALVLLLILGGGAATAGYFLVLKPMLAKQGGVITETPNSNTNSNANTSASPSESAPANANSSVETKKEPEPFTPPADAVQFTNSEANLDGDLAAHYVGFNFYYPKSWTKDPSSGVRGASSFAILNSKSSDETGEYLQERVIFNWYPSKGSFAADTDVFKQSSKKITDQLAKNLPEFEEVSHAETTINTYKGYEVRFKGVYKNTGGKGDLPYWGRVIFLPPGSETDKGGIAIVMLATSLAQDVTSAEDVGAKGGMALILDSLRLSHR